MCPRTHTHTLRDRHIRTLISIASCDKGGRLPIWLPVWLSKQIYIHIVYFDTHTHIRLRHACISSISFCFWADRGGVGVEESVFGSVSLRSICKRCINHLAVAPLAAALPTSLPQKVCYAQLFSLPYLPLLLPLPTTINILEFNFRQLDNTATFLLTLHSLTPPLSVP